MITSNGWSVLFGSVVLFVSGALLGYPVIVAIAVAGVLLVAIGSLWMINRSPVETQRVVEPPRVTVGEVAYAELTVRNRSSRRMPSQQAFDRIAERDVRVALSGLSAGQKKTVRYRLPTEKRGLSEVGPLSIVQGDPLGLLSRRRSHGDVRTLWVHPRRHHLTPLPSTLSRSLDGPTSDSAPRGSMTFHAVREYQHGDELRHIHWPATAHAGELMVREHIDTSQPNLTVVLDIRVASHTATTIEEAIEVAASLVETTVQQGFHARLVTTSGGRVESGSGSLDTTPMLDHLAAIELADEGDLMLVDRLLGNEPRSHAGVVVMGAIDERDAVALRILRQRFAGCAIVSLGAGQAVDIPGVASLTVPTAQAFAQSWNGGLGS